MHRLPLFAALAVAAALIASACGGDDGAPEAPRAERAPGNGQQQSVPQDEPPDGSQEDAGTADSEGSRAAQRSAQDQQAAADQDQNQSGAETAVSPPSHTPPQRYAEIIVWLAAAYRTMTFTDTVAALAAAGNDIVNTPQFTADIDGDGDDEWLLPLSFRHRDDPVFDFWIVDAEGVVWRFNDETDASFWGAPAVVDQQRTTDGSMGIADFTGDGLDDVLIGTQRCDNSGCLEFFILVSAHFGQVRNVVHIPPIQRDSPASGIFVPNVVRLFIEDGENDVGFKVVRLLAGSNGFPPGHPAFLEHVEVWGWNGVRLVRGVWTFRVPAGNTLQTLITAEPFFLGGTETDFFASDGYDAVRALDPSDPEALGVPQEVLDAARQYAGFRRTLLTLRTWEDTENPVVLEELRFLDESYPGARITRAANLLLDSYALTSDLRAACEIVNAFLIQDSGNEPPLGPLSSEEFFDPPLSPAQLCRVDSSASLLNVAQAGFITGQIFYSRIALERIYAQLQLDEPADPPPGDTPDNFRIFAGARMLLSSFLIGDTAAADLWLSRLEADFPDGAYTALARDIAERWQEDQDIFVACVSALQAVSAPDQVRLQSESPNAWAAADLCAG